MEVDTNVHQIMVSIAGLTFKPFLQRFLIWIDTLHGKLKCAVVH